MSSSQQDDREAILDGLRSLPRIERAICGGLDDTGRWERGILDRVKRLEDIEDARAKDKDKRYARETSLTVAVIALALKQFWDWISGKQ